MPKHASYCTRAVCTTRKHTTLSIYLSLSQTRTKNRASAPNQPTCQQTIVPRPPYSGRNVLQPPHASCAPAGPLPPGRAGVVVVREGHGGGAVGVRVGYDELELPGLRVEGADLAIAPAGHDRAARPGDAHTEALQVRHLWAGKGGRGEVLKNNYCARVCTYFIYFFVS